MKTNSLLSFLIMIAFCLNPLFAQWVKIPMPGSRSGIIYSICFKGEKMFAGIKGGVYVSSDNGGHWLKVNPDLPSREFGAIAFSIIVNDEKVIAAFSEPGVYLTSNDGVTWEMADIDAGLRATPNVLAADGDWIVGGNVVGHTYQSTDNGLTWSQISDLSYVCSIAIQDSVAIAYSTSYENAGIYLSTDYGYTWENVYPVTSYYNFKSSVAISESNVIAGIENGSQSQIFYSSDKGLTWNQQSVLNCNSINAIIFSPEESGNNFIFAATDIGVFRSSNNGLSWDEINNGLTSKFITSFAFKSNRTGGNPTLFAGTGNGIFCSKDFGETWAVVSSPSEWLFASAGSQLFAVSSNSSFSGSSSGYPDDIYYNMVFRSTDDGLNWANTYSGYLNNNFQITSFDASTDGSGNVSLFAAIVGLFPEISQPYSMVITSDDLGESWRDKYPDSTNRKIALKTISTSVFLSIVSTGATAFIRSTDKGNTWEQIDSNFVSAICFENNSYYAGGGYEFVIPNPNPPPRLLRYRRNYLLNSTDNGISWLTLESPLDSAVRFDGLKTDTLSIITALHTKNSNLLAGMRANYFYESPYVFPFAYGGGLIHFEQDGSNWVVADSSFIGKSVFDFESLGNDIFAATESGVFHSNNFGTAWDDISSGMDNIYTSSLFKYGSYLYASTINGLWKRPLSEITSVEPNPPGGEIPKNYSLFQNYPNPFNPATQIKYAIPENSYISLKVYNLLGEVVSVLFEGEQQAGNYSVVFDGTKFSSGVYFYQLKANDFLETKKLILLK